MSIEIIQHRELIEDISYELCYWYKDNIGNWGFGFPCDEHGNVLLDQMADVAIENYEKCRAGSNDTVIGGVKRRVSRWWQDRIGRCHCGADVYLNNFTNECDNCGRLFNSSGQELSDPSNWGEETGEHPADILRIR